MFFPLFSRFPKMIYNILLKDISFSVRNPGPSEMSSRDVYSTIQEKRAALDEKREQSNMQLRKNGQNIMKNGEGDLSRVRSGLVNESRLAAAAREIDLGRYLQLGKGEQRSRGQQKFSILADAFEALVAAVYLDGGFVRAYEVISRHFAVFLDAIEEKEPTYDFKSLLQEYVQGRHQDMPAYEIIEESGPDHDKTFEVSLAVGDFLTTFGIGKSKKAAEQNAACMALEKLQERFG